MPACSLWTRCGPRKDEPTGIVLEAVHAAQPRVEVTPPERHWSAPHMCRQRKGSRWPAGEMHLSQDHNESSECKRVPEEVLHEGNVSFNTCQVPLQAQGSCDGYSQAGPFTSVPPTPGLSPSCTKHKWAQNYSEHARGRVSEVQGKFKSSPAGSFPSQIVSLKMAWAGGQEKT